MYDIHCHILAGVDDGAKDIQDSLAMSRIAYDEGIDTIVATPHYIHGESEVSLSEILDKIGNLSYELQKRRIGLTILPGMEVYMTLDLPKLYDEGKVITLNCKKYMLIELPLFSSLPHYMEDVLFNIMVKGVIPVIAHPERCNAIMAHPNIVYKLINQGCLIQVNSGSIEGIFGKTVQKTAFKLLEHNMVHAVASDNHSTLRRSMCLLKDSQRIVAKKFGQDFAEKIYVENKRRIIQGENVPIGEPRMIRRRKLLWF